MTRCYEYYCMYKKLPEKCELSEAGESLVRKYMRFMEGKGIKFDGSDKDKENFKILKSKFGSEFVVTQKKKTIVVIHTPVGEYYEVDREQLCPMCGHKWKVKVREPIDPNWAEDFQKELKRIQVEDPFEYST